MINSGKNIEELLASATKNGMYLVNDSNTDALEEEYEVGVVEVDRLCEIIDPESNPFDSKYKARKIMDDVCNKLEATRTIAQLENKRDVIASMNKKIGDFISVLDAVFRMEFDIVSSQLEICDYIHRLIYEAQPNFCLIEYLDSICQSPSRQHLLGM